MNLHTNRMFQTWLHSLLRKVLINDLNILWLKYCNFLKIYSIWPKLPACLLWASGSPCGYTLTLAHQVLFVSFWFLFFFFCIYLVCVCVCVCGCLPASVYTCMYTCGHTGVRWQLSGVAFFLSHLGELWGISEVALGSWCQRPLPVEPSHQHKQDYF